VAQGSTSTSGVGPGAGPHRVSVCVYAKESPILTETSSPQCTWIDSDPTRRTRKEGNPTKARVAQDVLEASEASLP
jgi:hypothetical protein